MNHGNCAYRPVRCQDNSISVNNLSSCRFDFSFSLMKIFRQLLIMCSIKNLPKRAEIKRTAQKKTTIVFFRLYVLFFTKNNSEKDISTMYYVFFGVIPVCLSAITLNLYWIMLPSCPNPAYNFHQHMSRLHYCNHLYSPDHNQNTLYLQSSDRSAVSDFPLPLLWL